MKSQCDALKSLPLSMHALSPKPFILRIGFLKGILKGVRKGIYSRLLYYRGLKPYTRPFPNPGL